jgi:hypothetical protein
MKDGVLVLLNLRGKHRNILVSFPKKPSHYSRSKSDTEYLSPDLTLQKMYNLYREQNPETNVSNNLCDYVFMSDLHLRFGVPHSDACIYCTELYIQLTVANTEEEHKKVLLQSHLHHAKSDLANKALKCYQERRTSNTNLVVLCVDLQVLFCPTLTHSSMF